MTDERSPGGSAIYRHQQAAPHTGGVAHANDQRITEHLRGAHGGESMVFHELVSDRVHLDVHVIYPTAEQPYYLLCTSGVSARPMNVPASVEGADSWRYAELCMLLPPNWTPTQEAFRDERVYWPVRLLKTLGRIPHEFDSWLGWGHSIPNGDPPAPYAPDTQLCGAVLIPPFLIGDSLFVAQGEPPLHVFQVLPITAAEMSFKLQVGLDGLLDRLESAISDKVLYGPVDPLRPSVV